MKTEIVFILDQSGSMGAMRSEAIGGFNSFLKEQKKVKGEANITLVLFDHRYDPQKRVAVKKMKPLTDKTYVPMGTTALFDAIGKSVNELEKVLPKKKPNVVFVILTDGQENASSEFTKENIKTLIDSKRKEKWEFIFLAANQDAFSTASAMGIPKHSTANYNATTIGTRSAFDTVSCSVASYRTGGDVSIKKDPKGFVKTN